MKKFLFTVSLVFAISIVFGQQVNRDKVIVEIGTGTWCTYCPGAAMGADDLGSTMIEENVVRAAGVEFTEISPAEMERLITDLGYAPQRRDALGHPA